jgi:ubiquitin C-terminal hydrolase
MEKFLNMSSKNPIRQEEEKSHEEPGKNINNTRNIGDKKDENPSNIETTNKMIQFEEYMDKGLTGLANLGNTCFLNSTLQCISHTYELNNFLNNESYKSKINKKPESLILVEWDNLRKLMWSENCVISPGGFVGSIQKIARIKDKDIFTGYAQNDLPEFLLFLIDCFHETINRGVNMNITGVAHNDKDKLAIKCYEMLNNMYKNDYSEIVGLFYGISVTQIYRDNTILRQNPEPFFLLNLPVPSEKQTCTLMDCFDLYTKHETLDGENKWFNDDTNTHEEVNKNVVFFSLPDVLIMDLKRFNNSTRKTNTLIDFPLENMDLSKYVIGYNKYDYQYDLYGICNHSGSSMGGHYTAYVKNANGKWYLFNDTNISEVTNIPSIVSSKAYCLFYRKKNKI